MAEMTAWLNGDLVVAERAFIPVSDRGFTLGDGVFESMEVRQGRVPHLADHLARLQAGLGVLGLDLDLSSLPQAVHRTILANGVDQGMVRLTVSRGSGPRGLLPPARPDPVVVITALSMAPMYDSLRLITATVTRRNEFSPLSRIKSLNYLDNILARQQAEEQGAGDALLLNSQGRVCETTVSNLIVHLDGRVVTPPLADGVLPGIRRGLLIAAGLVEEQSILPAQLLQAQGMVTINSLSIRPVVGLDGLDLEPELGQSLAQFLTDYLRG